MVAGAALGGKRALRHRIVTEQPRQRGESGVRQVHASGAPIVVVLVEDEEDLRQAMTEILEDAGVRVTAVGDVVSLRAVFERLTPDILLTDFHLPDGTVEEFLSELLAQQRLERIHILSASPNARAVAARLGVKFLAKPFDLEALLATLRPDRTHAA
jgi:DNA-binding response OmpR family regulator